MNRQVLMVSTVDVPWGNPELLEAMLALRNERVRSRRWFITRSVHALGAIAVAVAAPHAARAASDDDEPGDYPSRPLHLIVSFPAGTAVDALARLVGRNLATALGQPVVVENHPGAAGNLGTALAARAAPDGYTLAVAGAAVTIDPSVHGGRAVDPVHAFAPVIQLTMQPIVLVAHPSLRARSLGEVLALARSEPQHLAYSTPGIGTPTHIAAELLAQRASITWLHVPYAGSGQLLSDVLSGDVPLSFTLLGAAQPFLRDGRLRAVAVTTTRRVDALPEVPTIAESGFPGFEISSWHGIVAPAGTPKPIIARLNFEIAVILRNADVLARLRALGMEAAPGTPAAFGERIASEVAHWRAVVEKAGITAER
jgi:tripartite-type tricarboxylate transporter receptor subunit TctC